MKIAEVTHPEYDENISDWGKFRKTYAGGSSFIDKYLKKFSTREDDTDYNERKAITYCPAHAKAAINEIKNSIFQRMSDIVRINGTMTYMQAIQGIARGVDSEGNTMSGFIGRFILPELLTMAKVGVFIDRQPLAPVETRASIKGKTPYLYYYRAEDIRSWSYDSNRQLVSLLLRNNLDVHNQETGLIEEEMETFLLFRLIENNVLVNLFDKDSNLINEYALNIDCIPFVTFEITSSLLTDVADYQIAHLNMASSDVNFAVKANIPLYTEQYDPRTDLAMHRQSRIPEEDEQKKASDHDVKVGVSQGRRYPINTDRPGYIHPSAEPMRASMDKQDKLAQEVRLLVNLALSNIEPRRASAESKNADLRGLEAGLSAIGMELEFGEREISKIWAKYENQNIEPTIKYPQTYSLKSDEERRKDAESLDKYRNKIPSKTFQKVLSVKLARLLVGHEVSYDEFEQIKNEILSATVTSSDPETIKTDHELGFVSTRTASLIRGYEEGEAEQAKTDHAERAARIVLAQTNPKGVPDVEPAE